ncbi:hypothetical protein EK0264_14010 [Epidermidibacterium keratini]|uniref:Septum formation initiator family protein n=1 Tax=Epidermidibacterium keratini TaxID=1891644 RepID=A0A7L4YR82_9ACTN|nr:septum formation initiator family protein [Epidermidibacterium keratini]QHC01289.1 hypothetical protein EK0264_14010 [Epidermidibacterium keratini]
MASPRDRKSTRRGPAATSGRTSRTRSASSRPGTKPARKASERPTQMRRSSAQPTRSTAAAAARARSRAGGLNSRAIALGALVIACVLLLILPVSNYLSQRSQIQNLQDEIAATQASINDLKDQQELLEDPAYLKAQARERLGYIEAGEKVYVVSNNDPESDQAAEQQAQAEKDAKAKTSAAQDLASSIAEADG